MKTKLLRRLRKRIVLLERNGRYKVLDTKTGYASKFWLSGRQAIQMRSAEILSLASIYDVSKKVIY